MILLVAAAWAGELGGYAEVRAGVYGGVEGTPWDTVERVRPSFEHDLHERVRVATTVEGMLVQGRYPLEEGYALIDDQIGHLLEPAGCSLEAPPRISGADEVLSVERLYVDLYHPRVDVRIGRQALNWGSALFLNPTDLFGEVLIAEPYRERRGVDAIRATVPVGEAHQVLAVAAIDEDLESGRFGLKPTFNVASTDISPVLGYRSAQDDFLGGVPSAGLDVRGQLVVGWWVEGRADLDDLGEIEPVVSAGVDYSLPVLDRLFFAAQYTYDRSGKEDPASYHLQDRGLSVEVPECAGDIAPEVGEPRFTIGRHYGLLTGQAAYETVSVQLSGLMNLQDRSSLLVPQVTWTPGDRWSIAAGGNIPLGSGEFKPTEEMATFRQGFVELDVSGLVPTWTAYGYVRLSL